MEMVPSPVETIPSESFVTLNDQNESSGSTDLSTQSKDDLDKKPEQTLTESVPSTPAALIPSLKGVMTYSGGSVICKGKWAMSDEQHEVDGQSSDFEFKLIKADQDTRIFPVNGKYQGWFLIKQPPPLKGVKVDDKDMIMKFTPNSDGTFAMNGNGHNRLGKFNLRGTLHNDGSVHIYREYYQLTPVPAHATQKKSTPAKPTSKETEKKPSPLPVLAQPPSTVEVPTMATPRESAGRIRKQSSLLKEFHDPLQKSLSRSTSREISSSSGAVPVASSSTPRVSTVTTERTHRLSSAMKKCADLLKELSKLHQAQWFLEPVDPVKFNIPDYPKIIKNPMDFSTIRKKIENGVYDSINAFAEDMRLVFRNAITYNTTRDSLVNIAAREISSKFEDKFRILVTQLEPGAMTLMDQQKPRLTGIKRTKSRDFGMKQTRMPAGPRPLPVQYSLPPAAVDGSTYKILEMQQMIASMQDELKQLRTVVKESEISKKLNESKEAAQHPLSFEEKKVLVGQIHKLPADKMERVLAIIQEAMPSSAEGIVEIPIDSLDTLTLRKLQHFVSQNTQERKKRQYSAKADGIKRPRKARTPKTSANDQTYNPQQSTDQGDLDYLEGEDDLLFEADTLDDMKDEADETGNADPDAYANEIMAEYEKLKAKGNVFIEDINNTNPWMKSKDSNSAIPSNDHLDSPHDGLTSSGNDVEEEDDDDNLWNEAAAEMQKKKPRLDTYSV